MPYFKWRGVDLTATMQRGTTFARSAQELDQQLFEQQIALLSSKPVRLRWGRQRVRLRDLINSLRQLTVLVNTGVLLPEALSLVSDQAKNPRLKEMLHTIADDVTAGKRLSDAMRRYPKYFTSIVVQLIDVGQASGGLSKALDAVCDHLERIEDFYTRLRSALLLPGLTLGFFLFIGGVIFAVIIPYFSDLFASMGREVPFLTRVLMGISGFVRSWYALGMLAVLLVGSIGIWLWGRTKQGSERLDAWVLFLPIIGSLLRDRLAAYLLHAVSLLLEGGVPLTQALGVVRLSVSNHALQSYVADLEQAVSSGSALSDAMRTSRGPRFGDDLIAMVRVGEESGTLAFILKKGALVMHERIVQRLTNLTTLVQPMLMILLGLLITILVFAVYGPIVTMAQVV